MIIFIWFLKNHNLLCTAINLINRGNAGFTESAAMLREKGERMVHKNPTNSTAGSFINIFPDFGLREKKGISEQLLTQLINSDKEHDDTIIPGAPLRSSYHHTTQQREPTWKQLEDASALIKQPDGTHLAQLSVLEPQIDHSSNEKKDRREEHNSLLPRSLYVLQDFAQTLPKSLENISKDIGAALPSIISKSIDFDDSTLPESSPGNENKKFSAGRASVDPVVKTEEDEGEVHVEQVLKLKTLPPVILGEIHQEEDNYNVSGTNTIHTNEAVSKQIARNSKLSILPIPAHHKDKDIPAPIVFNRNGRLSLMQHMKNKYPKRHHHLKKHSTLAWWILILFILISFTTAGYFITQSDGIEDSVLKIIYVICLAGVILCSKAAYLSGLRDPVSLTLCQVSAAFITTMGIHYHEKKEWWWRDVDPIEVFGKATPHALTWLTSVLLVNISLGKASLFAITTCLMCEPFLRTLCRSMIKKEDLKFMVVWCVMLGIMGLLLVGFGAPHVYTRNSGKMILLILIALICRCIGEYMRGPMEDHRYDCSVMVGFFLTLGLYACAGSHIFTPLTIVTYMNTHLVVFVTTSCFLIALRLACFTSCERTPSKNIRLFGFGIVFTVSHFLLSEIVTLTQFLGLLIVVGANVALDHQIQYLKRMKNQTKAKENTALNSSRLRGTVSTAQPRLSKDLLL